jgi:hypothetical protein
MCFVWNSERTAIISLYSINWQVFITETEYVYCAVRTGSLYIIEVSVSSLCVNWWNISVIGCVNYLSPRGKAVELNEWMKGRMASAFAKHSKASRHLWQQHCVVLSTCHWSHTVRCLGAIHVPSSWKERKILRHFAGVSELYLAKQFHSSKSSPRSRFLIDVWSGIQTLWYQQHISCTAFT